MNEWIPEVEGFVKLHGSKIAHLKGDRVAHLVEFNGSVPLDCKITPYTVEDIVNNFNTDSPLIPRVIKQINTHDIDKEKVLGLIFGKSDVLCHVITVNKM